MAGAAIGPHRPALAGRHIDERKGGARWRCNKSIGGADLIEVGQGGLFALSSKWLPLSMVCPAPTM